MTRSIIKKYRQAADRYLDSLPDFRRTAPRRTPLTASQHILHLLLSVFTCGLWVPVWIFRAIAGNSPAGQPPLPYADSRDILRERDRQDREAGR